MFKRLLFGIEVGGLLALLAIPAVAGMLWLVKAFAWPSVLVATTPASLSAVILAATVMIVPDLSTGFKIRMPMNLAFPLMFAVVNLVVVRGMWFAPGVVRSPHEVLNPIQLWLDPKMILATFVVQVVALTIACRPWASEPSQAESDPAGDGS